MTTDNIINAAHATITDKTGTNRATKVSRQTFIHGQMKRKLQQQVMCLHHTTQAYTYTLHMKD